MCGEQYPACAGSNFPIEYPACAGSTVPEHDLGISSIGMHPRLPKGDAPERGEARHSHYGTAWEPPAGKRANARLMRLGTGGNVLAQMSW
ncbi:hypothetical protein GCM10009564_32710 [Streptomyces thermogriseus]|uniref:Uncharacterized protein n=1 Tax=Streptomyces thermogriseus TaxID=75292 RepID=A0ABN1T1I9_9ACTN